MDAILSALPLVWIQFLFLLLNIFFYAFNEFFIFDIECFEIYIDGNTASNTTYYLLSFRFGYDKSGRLLQTS